MDDKQRAEALRVCDEASPAPWAWDQYGEKENAYHIGVALDKNDEPQQGRVKSAHYDEEANIFVEDILWNDSIGQQEGSTVNYDDADFICHARGNAEGTTGYAAVLRAVGIWQEGYARLQGEWDKLFDAGVEYMEAADVCSDGLCGKCAQCRLGKAINHARPPVPPFHFEEAEEAVRKDEGRERLAKDAAAYRTLLDKVKEVTGHWLKCERACCPKCELLVLIDNAEPCQAPEGDGKRQGTN